MRRNQRCTKTGFDASRLDDAYYIVRNPVTEEVSWPPTRMEDELVRLGLIGGNEGKNGG